MCVHIRAYIENENKHTYNMPRERDRQRERERAVEVKNVPSQEVQWQAWVCSPSTGIYDHWPQALPGSAAPWTGAIVDKVDVGIPGIRHPKPLYIICRSTKPRVYCARYELGEHFLVQEAGFFYQGLALNTNLAQECVEDKFLWIIVFFSCRNHAIIVKWWVSQLSGFLRVLARIFAFLAQKIAFPTRSCAAVFGLCLLFPGLHPLRVPIVLPAS